MPRIELGTFRVLSGCDNHYTTLTLLDWLVSFHKKKHCRRSTTFFEALKQMHATDYSDYGTMDGGASKPNRVGPVPILKRGDSGRKRSISVEFQQQTEPSCKIVRRLTEEEKQDLYKERPDLKGLHHANIHTIMKQHARQQKRVFVVATLVLIVLVVALTVYLIRFFLQHRRGSTAFRLGGRYKIT